MYYAKNGQVSTSPIPDGIEITEQQYHEAIDGILSGKNVVVEGGKVAIVDPVVADPEPVDLETLKGFFVSKVDEDSENERLKLLTPGVGQAIIYRSKLDEAQKFVSETDPDPADYPMLSNEVGLTAKTISGVAQAVLAAYKRLLDVGMDIERVRIEGKLNILSATTASDVENAYEAFSSNLLAIGST